MKRLQANDADRIRAELVAERHNSADKRASSIARRFAGQSGPQLLRSGSLVRYDSRTIGRWVHAYERDGYARPLDHSIHGRPAWLSRQQLQDLDLIALSGPAYLLPQLSGQLLARHMACYYHVELGLRQCQRLLERKKAAAKVPPKSAPGPRRDPGRPPNMTVIWRDI